MVNIVVGISKPHKDDVLPPRVVHLQGTIGAGQNKLSGPSVQVRLGDTDTQVRMATMGTVPHLGQWSYDGALPDDVPDGAQIRISVTGESDVWAHNGTDTESADPGTAEVQVTIGSPDLALTMHYAPLAQPASVPYTATITGTTAGGPAEVTGVSYAVQGGPSGLAVSDPPGDWSTWTAQVVLPDYRDYHFQVTAKGTGQRVAAQSGVISVHEQFETSDQGQAFGPTIYVRELCNYVQDYVRVKPGQAPDPGPSRADLTARFRQPFDRLPDRAVYAAATAPVLQARVAVEVLRRSLGPPAPAQLDQRLNTSAYQTLLRELGTSHQELRVSRVAERPAAAALAARLGVDPDRLDQLILDLDTITADQLEHAFGFRSLTAVDPFASSASQPVLLAFRQSALLKQWQLEDEADRDSGAGPLPVIDPDHVLTANLQSQQPGDPAFGLWQQRQNALQALADQIDQTVKQAGRTVPTFDLLVKTNLGPLDVLQLLGRLDTGEDVTPELAAMQLDVPSLRYLGQTRALLAADKLTDAEWADLRDLLVGVGKRRQFTTWRKQERAAEIVLQPAQFTVDPVDAVPDPLATPRSAWRSDPRTHRDWLHTLEVRTSQARRLSEEYQAVLDAAEAAVLPAARDALLALIGSRQSLPASGKDTAERLTRELCIDFLSDSPLMTTRADQGAETLLSAMLALRAGQLPAADGKEWEIVSPVLADGESEFDAKWQWMSSYQTWYAAITSFAYPENHLFPALYLNNEVRLHPTAVYTTMFLPALREQRITPQRARTLASANWARWAQTASIRDALKDLVPTSETHTTARLAAIRTTVGPLYLSAAEPDVDQTSPTLDRQLLRELFWLVPVALGQALQDAGHFQEALDWYEYAYAYRLPPGERRVFPGLASEQGITSTYSFPSNWPVAGSNPHEVAKERADCYTRFTVLSIVTCLLSFADSEFVRDTALANARARALYETALDLSLGPDASPETDSSSPFPGNPVWAGLRSRAQTGLDKIHHGLNIASAWMSASNDVRVLPSQYRYSTLVERAKNLVAIAQQLESAFLAAAEQRDSDAYTALQASRDLAVAGAMIGVEDLKVAAAAVGVEQAKTQQEKASVGLDHYQSLIEEGKSGWEYAQLASLGTAIALETAASAVTFAGTFGTGGTGLTGIGSGLSQAASAASMTSQLFGTLASFERRQQEWELQRALAAKDVELGQEQVALAQIQQQIASGERAVAGIQLLHAAATADFLATRFINTELLDWMSGVLNRVYAYFLQQATALARLAQAQLAFERQEPEQGIVQNDYWQGPPDPQTGSADTTDRPGPDRVSAPAAGHHPARPVRLPDRPPQTAPHPDRVHLPVRRPRAAAVPGHRRAHLRHPAGDVRPRVPRTLPAAGQAGPVVSARRRPARSRHPRKPVGFGDLPDRGGCWPLRHGRAPPRTGGDRLHITGQCDRTVRARTGQRDAHPLRRDGRGHRLAARTAQGREPLRLQPDRRCLAHPGVHRPGQPGIPPEDYPLPGSQLQRRPPLQRARPVPRRLVRPEQPRRR